MTSKGGDEKGLGKNRLVGGERVCSERGAKSGGQGGASRNFFKATRKVPEKRGQHRGEAWQIGVRDNQEK